MFADPCITQPSSSVVSHVGMSGNVSVLSSIKYSLHYIIRLLEFTDVCVYGGTVENLYTITLGVI